MKKAEKVYISVDIEGMEGVVSCNQTSRGKNDYPLARKRLTYDVNEAIRAAVDCGATEIVVSEGHGDLENLLLDELHPAADLISGAISPSLQMQGIEDGFDAMIVFGHAGGGMSLGGVLDHTYNGRRVHAMRLNGMTVNTEAICNAVIAGHYGVPLAASSVANHLRAKHGVLLRGISKPSGSCLRFYYRFNKLPHFKNIINL